MWSSRAARLAAALISLGVLVTSCSIRGDDDDDETRIETPTIAATVVPTSTRTPAPTNTPEPSPTATSTPSPTPTATPTPTPRPPTPTPLPTIENPFAGVQRPDEVLENYTLSYSATFTSEDDTLDQIDLLIEQHSPTSYHVSASGNPNTGREAIEVWATGDRVYLRDPGGEIFELPSAVDATLFSPSAYVILTPDMSGVPRALDLGAEQVEGRQTTHYLVRAEHVARAGLTDSADVQNPQGQIDIWIDDEHGFVVKMTADVSWTDEDGNRRAAVIDYVVTAVGTTEEIAAPV